MNDYVLLLPSVAFGLFALALGLWGWNEHQQKIEARLELARCNGKLLALEGKLTALEVENKTLRDSATKPMAKRTSRKAASSNVSSK